MAPTRKKSSTPGPSKPMSAQKRDLIMPETATAPTSPSVRLPPTPKYSTSNPHTPEEFRRNLSPTEFRSFKAYRNAIRGVAPRPGQSGQLSLPADIHQSDKSVVEKAQPPRQTSVVLSGLQERKEKRSAKISPSLWLDDSSSTDEDGGWATEDEYDDHNVLDFVGSQDEELYFPSSSDQEDINASFLGDSDDTESSSYDSDFFVQQQSRRGTVASGYLCDAEPTPRVHFEDEEFIFPQGIRSSFELKCGNAREVPVDDNMDREGEPELNTPLSPQSKRPAQARRAGFLIYDDDTDSEHGISPQVARRARLNARGEEVPSDDESLDEEVGMELDDDEDDDEDVDEEDEEEDDDEGGGGGNAPAPQGNGNLPQLPAAPPHNLGDTFSDPLEHEVSDFDRQDDPWDGDGDILTGGDDGTRLDRRRFPRPGWRVEWEEAYSDAVDQTPLMYFVGPGGVTVFELPPPRIRNILNSLHGAPLWVVDRHAVYDVWEPYQLPFPIPWPLPAWHPALVGINIQRRLPPGWSVHEYPTGNPGVRRFYYIDPEGLHVWFAPVQMNRAPEFNTTHQYAPDGLLHPLAGPHIFAPPLVMVQARALADGVLLYTRPGAAPVQQQQQQQQQQQLPPQQYPGNIGNAGIAGNGDVDDDENQDDDDEDQDEDEDEDEDNTRPRGNKRRRSPGSSPDGSSSRPHKAARISRASPNGDNDDDRRRGTADSDGHTSEDEAERDALLERIARLEHHRDVLVEHLQRDLENVRDDRDQIETRLEDVQNDLAAVEARLAAVESQRTALQGSLDEAGRNLEECREHGRRLQRQLNDAARERDDGREIDKLRKQLDACHKHGKQLQSYLATARRQRDEAQAARNDVPQRRQAGMLNGRNALNEADSGSNNCQERCKELEQEIKELERRVESAQEAKATMEGKYSLQLELRDASDTKNEEEIKRWKDSFNGVKNILAEAQGDLRQANEALKKARQRPGASGDAGADQDCEGRCRRAEKAVWDTERRRKELDAQYRKLVVESDKAQRDLQRQLRAAQDQLAAQPSVAGHRGTARSINDRVAALTADLRNAQDLNEKLEEALEVARNELKAVKGIAKTKANEAADLQRRLDQCEKHGKALQKRIDSAKTGDAPVRKPTPVKPRGKAPVKPTGKAPATPKGKAAYQRGPNGRLERVPVGIAASEPEVEVEQGEDDVEEAEDDAAQSEDDVAADHAANDSDDSKSDDMSSESDVPLITSRQRSSRAKMQTRRRAPPLSSLSSRHQSPAPPFDPRVHELQHELRTAAVRTNRIIKWHNAQQEAHLGLRVEFDRLMEENGRLKRGREALIREVKGLVGVIEEGRK